MDHIKAKLWIVFGKNVINCDCATDLVVGSSSK